MKTLEVRFKIVALLVINMGLPETYQRKVDIVAQMIDRDSEYKLNALMLLEDKVLEYFEKKERLEELRNEIRNERISYGEISELQCLVDYIEPDDFELLAWAGVSKN